MFIVCSASRTRQLAHLRISRTHTFPSRISMNRNFPSSVVDLFRGATAAAGRIDNMPPESHYQLLWNWALLLLLSLAAVAVSISQSACQPASQMVVEIMAAGGVWGTDNADSCSGCEFCGATMSTGELISEEFDKESLINAWWVISRI